MGLEKVAKIENISKNELNQAEKLQKKSIDQLKGIDILRRIRNIGNLTKEDLIIALLKSVNSTAEHNFEKLFDNNTVDDDTNDGKIRGKISVMRMILIRLGNTVANNDRNKINKKLYETEKKKTLSNKEKENTYDDLVELAKAFDIKEKNKYHDRDDQDNYQIREIENLFDNDNDDDYYKPILVESSFKNNYKYYEWRGDKDKKLSVRQYLHKIMPNLSDLINDDKAIRNESNE